MYPSRILCVFLLLLLTSFSIYAQTATFSGRITDQASGQGIANVAVVAQGNQTGTRVAVTDAQGNYNISMGSNTNIKLRAYRTNVVFSPALAGFTTIGGFPVTGSHPVDFNGTSLPFPILIFAQAPILLTEDNSLKALALDSLFLKRDPFTLVNDNYFGADKRTRIKLLLVDLDLFSNETLSSTVTVQGVDQSFASHVLPIEDLRKVSGVPWMSQLTVRLPDDVTTPTDLSITVSSRSLASNVGTVQIQ
jgi:hypothetical protein